MAGQKLICMLQGKHLLPPVLFINGLQQTPGDGRVSTFVPPPTALCIFPSGNDLVGAREGAPAGAPVDTHGSLLANEVMVGGDNQFAGKQPLAAYSLQGAPLLDGQEELHPQPEL